MSSSPKKMASNRTFAFYRELNNLSTADYFENKKKRKTPDEGPFYEVERVVTRKISKGKKEYLVKWKGYDSLSNSWEPEENLNLQALNTYLNPRPSQELITSGVDALHGAILENIASRSVSPTIVPFRHDVFQYLFKDKGKASKDHGYILFEKKDFERCSFPREWDTLVDNLGDGLKIDFPVKVRLFVSRSPKNHTINKEKKIIPLPRYYVEKLSVNCKKEAFSISA